MRVTEMSIEHEPGAIVECTICQSSHLPSVTAQQSPPDPGNAYCGTRSFPPIRSPAPNQDCVRRVEEFEFSRVLDVQIAGGR